MQNKNALILAWGMAVIATAGSFFASEVLHWIPCVLCWYARIFLFPLVIILGVAIWKEIKDVDLLVLPLSIIGVLLGIFHSLLQYGLIPENLGPCTVSATCTVPYHFFYSWITMPLLSLTSFTVITIFMFIYRKGKV